MLTAHSSPEQQPLFSVLADSELPSVQYGHLEGNSFAILLWKSGVTQNGFLGS